MTRQKKNFNRECRRLPTPSTLSNKAISVIKGDRAFSEYLNRSIDVPKLSRCLYSHPVSRWGVPAALVTEVGLLQGVWCRSRRLLMPALLDSL